MIGIQLAAFLANASLGQVVRPQPLAPGVYCQAERIHAEFGGGKREYLGMFLMKLTLRKNASGYELEVWNQMPDNPQVFWVEAKRLKPNRSGVISFNFTDGWENRGRGNIYPSGKVTLDLVQSSDSFTGSNIQRNYGEFTLDRGSCANKAIRNF